MRDDAEIERLQEVESPNRPWRLIRINDMEKGTRLIGGGLELSAPSRTPFRGGAFAFPARRLDRRRLRSDSSLALLARLSYAAATP